MQFNEMTKISFNAVVADIELTDVQMEMLLKHKAHFLVCRSRHVPAITLKRVVNRIKITEILQSGDLAVVIRMSFTSKKFRMRQAETDVTRALKFAEYFNINTPAIVTHLCCATVHQHVTCA